MYRDSHELNLEGGRGVGALFGHKPTFGEIFSRPPLYYAGSTIEVEEIMTINSQILNYDLVDVDKRWFNERYYIGTYDSDALILNGLDLENSGRIMAFTQKVKRYSRYTIVANPNRPRSISFGGTVNQCNFELVGVSLAVGTLNIEGWRPTKDNALFNISTYKEPVSLADTEYHSFFTNPGFYCYEGAYIRSVDRQIAVINDIFVDDAAWSPKQCTLGMPDCDQEFSAYFAGLKDLEAQLLLTNPEYGSPPEFNHNELSASACRSYEVPLERTFNCADGGTRTYYFCGGGY
jgi:hypothetical protein